MVLGRLARLWSGKRDEPKATQKDEPQKEEIHEHSQRESPEMEQKIARITDIRLERNASENKDDGNYEGRFQNTLGYYVTDKWSAVIDNHIVNFETQYYEDSRGPSLRKPRTIKNFRLAHGKVDEKELSESDAQILWERWSAPMRTKKNRLDAIETLDAKESEDQKKKRMREEREAAQNQLHDATSAELDKLLR